MLERWLRSQAAVGGFRRHSADVNEACSLDMGSAVDHPHLVDQREQVALQEFDGVDHNDAGPVQRHNAVTDSLTHGGVNDRLELGQLCWVGEDNGAQMLAIDAPIRLQHVIPKCPRDRARDFRSWVLQLMDYRVGVDPLASAELDKDVAYRCLAAADRSREPEDARSCPRTLCSHVPCASLSSAISSP